MNIQEEIINRQATEMSREIDREVLWGMLEGIGWTRVIISSETAMLKATQIKNWLSLNCTGSYEKNRSDFIFEKDQDAVIFILKWK
jgi:hypothetical protein